MKLKATIFIPLAWLANTSVAMLVIAMTAQAASRPTQIGTKPKSSPNHQALPKTSANHSLQMTATAATKAKPKALTKEAAADDQLDAFFAPSPSTASALDTIMQDLLTVAKERHPNMKAAEARLNLAQAKLDSARAAFWPTLEAGGSVNQSTSRNDDGTRSNSQGQEVKLRLSQNIYRGGNDARKVDLARLDLGLEDLANQSTLEKLRIDITRAALEYNDAAVRQAIVRQSLAESQRLRDIAIRKQGAGLVGRIDIDSARLQEMEAETELKRLDTELTEKKTALAAALNTQGQDEPLLLKALDILNHTSFPLPTNPSLGKKPGLEHLRDERQAKERDKATTAIAIARAERWLPSLNAYAGISHGRQESRVDLVDADGSLKQSSAYRPRTELGLELSWTLFDHKASTLIDEQVVSKTQVVAQQAEENFASQTQGGQLAQQITDLYALKDDYRRLYQVAKDVHEAQRDLYQAGAADINAVINANLTRLSSLKNLQKLHFEINAAILNWQQNQLSTGGSRPSGGS